MRTITHTDSLAGVTEHDFADGFFDGWPSPPSRANHLRILRGSYAVVLARDADAKIVKRFGMSRGVAMLHRNYARQACEKECLSCQGFSFVCAPTERNFVVWRLAQMTDFPSHRMP